jgi:hypothetical protein
MKIAGVGVVNEDDGTTSITVRAVLDKNEVLELDDIVALQDVLDDAATKLDLTKGKSSSARGEASDGGGRRRRGASASADGETTEAASEPATGSRRRATSRSGGDDTSGEQTTRRRRSGSSDADADGSQSGSAEPSSRTRRRSAEDDKPAETGRRRRGAAEEPKPEEPSRRRRGAADDKPSITDADLTKAASEAAAELTPGVVKAIMKEDFGVEDVKDLKGADRQKFLDALEKEMALPA